MTFSAKCLLPAKMLTKADAERAGAKCASCPFRDHPYVPPVNPGQRNEFRGDRPSSGTSHLGSNGEKILRRLNAQAGIDPKQWTVDSVIACWPGFEPEEAALKTAETCCAPRLRVPTALVALDDAALRSVGSTLTVEATAGIPLPASAAPCHVFPVLHPSGALPQREPGLIRLLHVYWERIAEWAAPRAGLRDVQERGFQYSLKLWDLPHVVTNLVDGEAACALALAALTREAASGKPIGWDVENAMVSDKRPVEWETNGARLFDVGFGNGDRESPIAVCVSWATASPLLRQAVEDFLRNPEHNLVPHNGKHDTRVIDRAMGFRPPGYAADTMELMRMLFPGVPKDLGTTLSMLTRFPRHKDAFRATKAEMDTEAQQHGDRFASADPQTRAVYCGHDAFGTAYAARALLPLLGPVGTLVLAEPSLEN